MKARTWQKARLKSLIDGQNFRDAVNRVRSDLHTSPDARREAERNLKGRVRADIVPEKLALLALRLCQRAEDRPPPGLGGTTSLLLAARDYLLDDPDYLKLEAATVDHMFTLAAAVWTDYDGDEFELFCNVTQPASVFAFVPQTDESFEDWRLHFRPGHVYIDVTHASPKDVAEAWYLVNWHRRELGLTVPRKGSIRGAGRKGRKVVDGLSWEQVRQRVGNDPQMANAWERRYVEFQSKRGVTRRRALDNYRKNIRVPLNLRLPRGRRSIQ